MSIIDYTAPTKENRYAQNVRELAEAGEGKAFVLTAENTGDKRPTYERQLFQRAANEQGFTARLMEETEDPKAKTVSYTFILVDRYKPKTRKTNTDEAPLDFEDESAG